METQNIGQLMKKNILLIIGFTAAVIIFDRILFYLINNNIIADWSSVIIISFITGILLKPVFKRDINSSILILLPVVLLAVKFIIYILSVDKPSTGFMILLVVAYPVVSYVFIRLGTRINLKKE